MKVRQWRDIGWVGRLLYGLTYQLTRVSPSFAEALRWGAEVERLEAEECIRLHLRKRSM